MAKRSCHASQEGLKQIRRAYNAAGLTQEGLAETASVSRSTVSSFFAGKPIDRNNFVELCTVLDLNWEDIVDRPAEPALDNAEINTIVQTIREQIKPIVREKCGTIPVLDGTQPIELTGERGIYTNVNILKPSTIPRRLEILDLVKNCRVEEFDRPGMNRVNDEPIPGLEAVEKYHKLMVWGKPGAGKTTFLKYLAMQCIEEKFQANRIPVFITLQEFAEKEKPDLFTYISHLVRMSTEESLRRVLQQGRALVLLDGLDEIREKDTKQVLQQIRDFSTEFHSNQFVITCRIAANEYKFEKFTQVEVADFDQEQISIFAQNWFRLSEPTRAERFIQKLKENEPIQELASSPLLLTLLCLVFQDKEDFPKKRSELYQEGIELLLKQWDAKRGVERDEIHKNLSLKKKQDLLSQIALITFEQQEYFFKPEVLEELIESFFYRLPGFDSNKENLEVDIKAVLREIQAQHGLLIERSRNIYSFSHLTFHEYFAAREIVAKSAYKDLVKHLTEKRWREVFLLTTGMMRKEDDLLKLMKQNIDKMLADDEKLQRFLSWVNRKSISIEAPDKSVAIRAFYFSSAYNRNPTLALALARAFDLSLPRLHAHDLAHVLTRDLGFSRTLDFELTDALFFACTLPGALILNVDIDLSRALTRALDLAHNFDSELKRNLQEIRKQLPKVSADDRENSKRWWMENGQVWTEKLRTVMIEHRNIGHDWKFKDEQKQVLEQYYAANKLLIGCLNSDCYVSRDVRQEIEDTLFLPLSEIDRS